MKFAPHPGVAILLSHLISFYPENDVMSHLIWCALFWPTFNLNFCKLTTYNFLFMIALIYIISQPFIPICLLAENLALGKTATQSSTSSSTWKAGNAVDGNDSAGHCSKTTQDDPSWWRVDLGENLVPVSEIYIVNMFNAGSSVTNSNYSITFGKYIIRVW